MSNFTSTLIICPTYNERANIAPYVTRVMSCAPQVHILFVDDQGDDDTAAEIVRQQKQHKCITLLARPQRRGLARAYLAGLAWGLARAFEHFVTMDADLSHDPVYLAPLLAQLDTCDVAIGSRYIAGGGTKDWSWSRQLLSRFGSLYARSLLNLKVHDPTSGFVAFRRQALTRLDLAAVKSRGYIFQVELKYRAALAGCSLREVAIVFADRRQGKSKMSLAIALEAALYTWKLRRLGRKPRHATPMLL